MTSALEALAAAVEDATKEAEKDIIADAQVAVDKAKGMFDKARVALLEAHKAHGEAFLKAQQEETKIEALLTKASQARVRRHLKTDVPTLVLAAREEVAKIRKEADGTLAPAVQTEKAAKIAYDEALLNLRKAQGIRMMSLPEVTPTGLTETERRDLRRKINELTEEIDSSSVKILKEPACLQHARCRLWAGTARAIQDRLNGYLDNGDGAALRQVFGRINSITKIQHCGYVNALNREYKTDWQAYVSRTAEDIVRFQNMTPEELERQKMADEIYSQYEVKDGFVPTVEKTPDTNARKAREEKKEKRTEAASKGAEDRMNKAVEDVLPLTKGKSAVLVGGSVRETSRRRIQEAFQFSDLDWVETQHLGNKRVYSDMAKRVQGGSLSYVFLLAGFSSHYACEIKPLCERHGVKYVMIPKGYGVVKIASILRGKAAP